MAWQGYDPNFKAIENAEKTRHKKPGNEYNPNILATRRWMPGLPWRRPSASDTYDASAPFERRIILSPLALLIIALVLALVGLFFVLR